MPKSNFDDVGDFHEKFGLDNVTYHKEGPRVDLPQELMEFRMFFLKEELYEFVEAEDNEDHAKMFDALLDLVYVAMGTAHLLGYPWQKGWDRVQAANMTKIRAKKDGSNSLRHSSFDVVKPFGWVAPDIAGLLDECGWDVR